MKARRGVLVLLSLVLVSGCNCCQNADCSMGDGGPMDNGDDDGGPADTGTTHGRDAGPDAGPPPSCNMNGDPQASGSTFCTLNDVDPMPMPLADPAAVVQGGYVFVIGGLADTMGRSTTSAIYSSQIDPDTGALGPWNAAGANLPVALGETAAVGNNGFIYVMGGASAPSEGSTPAGQPVSRVSIFQVNPDGGTLSAVDGGSEPLPDAREGAAATILNGFVYVIGGAGGSNPVMNPDLDPSGPVQFAPINSDGSLGSWATTTPLPGGRWHFGAAAANGWVYVVGGNYPGSGSFCEPNKIYQAQQNSDGTLGNWVHPTTEFQIDLNFASVALVNGLLVVAGGVTHVDENQMGNTFWLAAEVSSTGKLGDWQEIAQYATPANERTIVAGPNAIYSFGGNAVSNNGPATLNTVTEHLVVQPSGAAWDCP